MTNSPERRQRGTEVWQQVTQKDVKEPTDPFGVAMIDFVSAEVWARPGLGRATDGGSA